MKDLLARLHARVGDLWWYSAMIFIACRTGDVINAFIGLWLVPKYVGQEELGAVLPLQQLTSFLTVPVGVVAIVFSKYVNTYAAHGEFGKVKGFIRDVLAISTVLFIFCIGGAYLIMPFFYERLNVAPGLLTVLILASGFVSAIVQLVGSAQQGLKRFKTMSLVNLISAPVRLVTMLVAMPFRPLSGYMLGQTTPNVVIASFSAVDVRNVLKSHACDHSWRKDWRSILNYSWPIAINTTFGLVFATLTATVYRQRLPEIESAANYMLSRFAEIASFFSASISVILFPLVSESHEQGKDTRHLLRQAFLGTLLPAGFLAILFFFASDWLFSLTDTWSVYRPYAGLLGTLTVTTGIAAMIGTCISYEMACRRFRILLFTITYNCLFIAFLVSFTGYSYFYGILPDACVLFMKNCHVASLTNLTYINLVSAVFQIVVIFALMRKRHPRLPLNRSVYE